jgi:hypothetical protein
MSVIVCTNESKSPAVTRSLYGGIRSRSTQELYAKSIVAGLPAYKPELAEVLSYYSHFTHSMMRKLYVEMSTLIGVVE